MLTQTPGLNVLRQAKEEEIRKNYVFGPKHVNKWLAKGKLNLITT